QRCLPPRQARLQGRAAARAAAADVRNHLARRGPRGSVARDAKPHAARAVHHAALRGARARDRPGDRVQAGRLHRRGGERGAVRADAVVNCAGLWAREVGTWAGVSVPLHAAEHFYIVTEPIAGLAPDLPVLRDADARSYFKEDTGKLLVGWFEPEAKPWGWQGIPENFAFEHLPADLGHIEPLFAAAMR